MRLQGSVGLTYQTRIQEVARLVVWGFSVGQIAQRFDVTTASVEKYIKDARKKGYIDKLSEARDSQVKQIVSRNLNILESVTVMLEEKVESWKTETDIKKKPNLSMLLAVANHTAKVSGTIKESETKVVNIQQIQQNILCLQSAEKELETRLKIGNAIDVSQIGSITEKINGIP